MPCEHYKDALIEAAATGADLANAPASAAEMAALRAHLAECASCRGAFQQEQSLFASIDAGLHQCANAELPASFLLRVRARLVDETPSRKRLVPVWGAVAATAALFLGFVILRNARHETRRQVTEPVAMVQSLALPEGHSRVRENPPTEHVRYASTPRRPRDGTRPSPVIDEPRALLPAEQPGVIARLLDDLRHGKVNGEVLLADRSMQSQDLRIAPLEVAPIEVKALESAQPELH